MTGPTTVVLFTCDLRVHDHPALWSVCSSGATVVPLFVVDPALSTRHLASQNRGAFLAESLHDLRRSLRDRGGELFVRRGDSVEEVLKVVSESGAAGVVLTEDVGLFAQARQARLQRACAAQRWSFAVHPGSSVVPAGAVTPAGRDHYAVFTPYWNRWRATPRRATVPAPRRVRVPAALAPGALPGSPSGTRATSPERLPGGERAGRARWARWARRHLAAYGEGHDDLAADSTSRIGAYLHFGCLSPLEVGERAGPHEPFVRQLCWRDFHRQVAFAFPELGRRDYRGPGRRWRHDPAAVSSWRDGRTGVPIVDAAMRQLRVEGFIHNRTRMLAAAYLTKELGVDWRIGAAHFADWLVDADVANNAGNWQWIAGTGNDTRPNRRFNLMRQARRHDPDGTYVRRYVPELREVPGGAVHEPWMLPEERLRAIGYEAALGLGPSARR